MMTFEDAVRIAEERTADVISARQDVLLADVQHILALARFFGFLFRTHR